MSGGRPPTHGMKGTSTYSTWNSMKTRCNNPNNDNYKNYGAKGIEVCRAWDKFENFWRDMGTKPEGLTLDRIDNSKGYYKENCRWADWETQENNKSNNRRLKVWGADLTVAQWAKRFDMDRHTLLDRLNRGMAPEDAIARPLGMPKLGRAKVTQDVVRHMKRFLLRHPAEGMGQNERVHLYAFLKEWYRQPKRRLRKIINGHTWNHVKP